MAFPIDDLPSPSNYLPGETPLQIPTSSNRGRGYQPTRDSPGTRTDASQSKSRKRQLPDSGFSSRDKARYNRRTSHKNTMDNRKGGTDLYGVYTVSSASALRGTLNNIDKSDQLHPPRQPPFARISRGPKIQEPLPAPYPLHPKRAGFLEWQKQHKDPRSPKTPPLDTYLLPSSFHRSSESISEHPCHRGNSSASTIRPESSISGRGSNQLRTVPNLGDLCRQFQSAEAPMQPCHDPLGNSSKVAL